MCGEKGEQLGREWFDSGEMKHEATKPRSSEKEETPLSYAVIGAAIEVHRILGPGYLESVYQAAMEVELELRGLHFDRQLVIPIEYKDRRIAEHVVDLVVEDLVVELKAVESFAAVHFSQVHSYLKAGAFDLGLLINFNVPVLKDGVRRIVRIGADKEEIRLR
jgi:GxxExxY protein